MINRFFSKGHFDPITASAEVFEKLPSVIANESFRRKMLDVILSIGVPFNRWLGMKLIEFSLDRVVVKSPPTRLRENHVGTAHACALALLGEYPAGLLVAQKYPLVTYRMIISKLEVEYHKAGRGVVFGTAEAPIEWPEVKNGEAWVEMLTVMTGSVGEKIADCRTRWQIKRWDKVRGANT